MITFIDEDYIKKNSPVTYNVQPVDLYPHLDDAQQIHIQNILGDTFYEDLLTKFDAGTLNTDEQTLVDKYLKPALLWRTLWLALPFLTSQLRSKGLIQYSDESGQQSDIKSFYFVRNVVEDRAGYRENLMVKYLKKNESLFPLYKNVSNDDIIKPDKEQNNQDMGFIFY